MIEFAGRGILLDIEGTTSSVRFVYDVMFPYVRRELRGYLERHWDDESSGEARRLLAADAGFPTLAAWYESAGVAADTRREAGPLVEGQVLRLMDGDVKATGLKYLQGLIWRSGFESGELRAHVYEDVPAALESWRAAGRDLRVYSSGSVEAQRLFFGHTIFGDLLPHFRGHYDTTIGGKKDAASYSRIAQAFCLDPTDVLFLSDVPAELDAARAAGMQTALCERPGNAEVDATSHPRIRSFAEIQLAARPETTA